MHLLIYLSVAYPSMDRNSCVNCSIYLCIYPSIHHYPSTDQFQYFSLCLTHQELLDGFKIMCLCSSNQRMIPSNLVVSKQHVLSSIPGDGSIQFRCTHCWCPGQASPPSRKATSSVLGDKAELAARQGAGHVRCCPPNPTIKQQNACVMVSNVCIVVKYHLVN